MNQHLSNACTWGAILLFLVAFWRYGRQIWIHRKLPFGAPGKPEPPKVTWLIWLSLDTITFAGMYHEHTLTGQIEAAMFGWILVALAFIYGKLEWTKLDKLCAAGAVLAVTLWKLSGDAALGIVVSNATIFFGSWPAFIGARDTPEKEDKGSWMIFWVSCLFQMAAVAFDPSTWTFSGLVQPVVFLVVNSTMVYYLWMRPRKAQIA